MKVFIDDTGSVSPNHPPNRGNYFGFGGLIINDETAAILEEEFNKFRKTNGLSKILKVNDPTVDEKLKSAFRKWLHQWIQNLETIDLGNDTSMYLDAEFIFDVDEKSPHKNTFQRSIEVMNDIFPEAAKFMGSEHSIAYNAKLLNTIILSLVGYKYVRESNKSELEIVIEENPYYQSFIKSIPHLKGFYGRCKINIDKYHKELPFDKPLPKDIIVTIAKKDNLLLQLVHNIITLCRIEEIKRRNGEVISEEEMYFQRYKGLFLRDDGILYKIFNVEQYIN